MFINLSNPRSEAVNIFQGLRFRAALVSTFAKAIGKNTRLASFSDLAARPPSNRKYLGLQEILVENITGSLGREHDFDRQFRPLNKHLRERWVNIYMELTRGELPPIRVYKLGGNYFVEDGHHRVSVARYLEKAYIHAEVWEYQQPRAKTMPAACSLAKCEVRVNETSPA